MGTESSIVRVATRVNAAPADSNSDSDSARSLSADEIVAQVVHAKRICRYVDDLPTDLNGVELQVAYDCDSSINYENDDNNNNVNAIGQAAKVLKDKRCFGFDES